MPLSRTRSVLLVSAVLGCGGGGGDDGGTTGPGPGPNNQTLGSIVLSTPSLTLTAGNMAAITVVAYDTENAIIANAGSPTFTSANPAVAEVDNQGNVRPLVERINAYFGYAAVDSLRVVQAPHAPAPAAGLAPGRSAKPAATREVLQVADVRLREALAKLAGQVCTAR